MTACPIPPVRTTVRHVVVCKVKNAYACDTTVVTTALTQPECDVAQGCAASPSHTHNALVTLHCCNHRFDATPRHNFISLCTQKHIHVYTHTRDTHTRVREYTSARIRSDMCTQSEIQTVAATNGSKRSKNIDQRQRQRSREDDRME